MLLGLWSVKVAMPSLRTVPLDAMAHGVVQNREVEPIHVVINSGPSITENESDG